ncbi:MAG: hypothetical protein CVT60_04510 [Actinobacteria bacterium HGW-Actinobacteria-10]|nr:MAG: hypothetical protein CVT60_04510 [Actinobacteria bacterium HGW-Actinobacteria-10]
MARKAEIWRVASTGVTATLAVALIPLAVSALASLSLDRAAHTAPLTRLAYELPHLPATVVVYMPTHFGQQIGQQLSRTPIPRTRDCYWAA